MITKEDIKALLMVASDVGQPRMCGIRFEPAEPGFVLLVATDGRRLLVLRRDIGSDGMAPSGLLPHDDAEKMVKTAKKGDQMSVGASPVVALGGITAPLTNHSDFPNWRQVLPDKISGKVAQFDPAFVADFGKVSALLGVDHGFITIRHNGLDAAVVEFNRAANAFAILMPIREDKDALIAPFALPAWITGKPAVKAA